MRLDDVLKRKSGAPANATLEDGKDEAGSDQHIAPKGRPPVASAASPASGRFGAVGWHSTLPPPLPRNPWAEMPTLNRFFCATGGLCLLLALFKTVGPAVADTVHQAYYPYTAAGKQQLCSTRLRGIAAALMQYAQDHDEKFPPLDYTKPGGQRVTWVSALQGRHESDQLQCPVGPSIPVRQEWTTASYAMNPVLGSAKAGDVDDPSRALLLADRGDKHDLALLPPYPSWPSYNARQPQGASPQSFDATATNVTFRHGNAAVVAYADGHAASLASGSWALEAPTWGGSRVLRQSLQGLAFANSQAGELVARLKAGNVAGAAGYLRANGKALQPVSRDIAALWCLNDGEGRSDSVEEIGWHLARARKQAGDASILDQLNGEETRRCQAEIERVKANGWETRENQSKLFHYKAPSVWTSSDEQEGRYQRSFIRAKIPNVYVVIERGERSQYTIARPVDWHSMEAEVSNRYGWATYKLLHMTQVTFQGQPAGLWEYETEKPGAPRLRRLSIGYVDGWASAVVTYIAPARDWEQWLPIFERIAKSVA